MSSQPIWIVEWRDGRRWIPNPERAYLAEAPAQKCADRCNEIGVTAGWGQRCRVTPYAPARVTARRARKAVC